MSFKGRENVYTCPKCGGFTVTIDVDAGVTPMFIECRASGDIGWCRGLAASAMYPRGPRPPYIPPPAWEWFRATASEALAADKKAPGMYDHFRKGGLFLRRIAVRAT